jgi:glycoside/pentoside/hexuronide:cation symporter, GPH family
MMANNQATGLKLKEKLGYGVGELGGSLFWITISFWLMNFITDELGLSASIAGIAILVGKLWDAVTDPVVGQLSDATKSRWGRRRPWFLFDAVPFGAAFFLMFFNPGLNGQTQLFLWVTLVFMLLCTAYTCVIIPYNALLPELSTNYNERSSLSGYKSVFAVLATLIGASLALPIMNLFKTKTFGFMGLGAVFGLIIVISTLIPFFTLKEKSVSAQSISVQKGNIIKRNATAFKNKPFRVILYTWVLITIGMTLITSNLIYYFKYVLNDENLMTLATIIMIGTSMVFIPITVKVSKIIGKNITYAIGMILFVVALIILFFAGHIVGITLVYILMFMAGIGMSTHYVMPWAIVPDTIDYGYAKTGVKQEGVYYGIWSFMIKIGQALSGLFLGIILDFFGYIPEVVQSNRALFGIRLTAGPIPAVFFIAGIWFLFKFPIDKNEYKKIQIEIERLKS